MSRRVPDGVTPIRRVDPEPATEAGTAITRAGPKLRRVRIEIPPLARGERIGRYVVIDVLGRGGMGIVYRAYDPDLDRRIALKLLRPTASAEDSGATAGRDRLLREAQALAQLAHPNVVSVFDVGVAEGDVFVAMELIDGATLRGWVEGKRPPIREVVRAFVSAGEGLAAAHDAGLVHRDFKPENIMVGKKGRVRVLDFGLARSVDDEHFAPRSSASGDDEGGLRESGSGSITEAGAVVGTPPYMAPEQFRQEGATALSDQYGFCVSLFEVLYGERPFPGRRRKELEAQVLSGEVVVPERVRVPARLARIIRRGMATDPADRYPSMHALLDELRRDPARTRRRIAAGVGAVALLGVAALAVARPGAESPAARCEALRSDFDRVWNPGLAPRLEQAFRATGKPFATDAADRVAAALDAYRKGWSEVRVEACKATRVQGTQSDQLLDLRMECLDRRRDTVASLVPVLLDAPTGDVVANAVDAVDRLPGVERCSDAETLRSVSPLPDDPAKRAEVDSLRHQLDQVEALNGVGRYVDALPGARAAAERSREIGYPPTRVEAFGLLASIEELAGDVKKAEPAYREELRAAAVAGDRDLLARAWVDYVDYVGNTLEKYDQALALAQAADLAIIAAGEPARQRAYLLSATGEIENSRGNLAEARATLEQALALREKSVPDDLVGLSITLDKLAGVQKQLGEYEAARGYQRRAIEVATQRFGGHHAKVGALIFNLGLIEMASGDCDKALERFDQARAIVEGAIGEDSPNVASMLAETGHCMEQQGKYEQALAAQRRALQIREKAFGPVHRAVAASLQGVADVLIGLERYDEAAPLLERALRIREQTLGPQHPQVGRSLAAIAGMYWDQGRVADALAYYKRTRDIYAVAYGKKHPFYAVMLLNIGDCELDLKRPTEAVPVLEEAVSILRAGESAPRRIGDAELVLAKALWRSGRDRKRARKVGRDARAQYAAAGDNERVADIDAWLARPR